MARIYKAILHGDKVEWIDTPPLHGDAMPIHIVLAGDSGNVEPMNGGAMANALDELAESGGLPAITDPVEWQKKLRRDRALPRADD